MTGTIEIKKGPVVGNILRFAIPLVFSGIVQLLFNAADTMAVGHFLGSRYLAAIGATAPLVALFSNSLIAFSQGVSVLISRRDGNPDTSSLAEITGLVLVVSLILGIIVGALGIVLAPWLLRIISTPEDIIGLSVRYLRIYLTGMPFFLFYNFGAAEIRALGNSLVSLIYVLISGACNVILNILFIRMGMGVAGVAVATVLSQLLSALLVGRYILKQQLVGKINWRYAADIIKVIFMTGVPAALQTLLLSLSNVVIQEEINRFGTTVLAGQAVFMSLNGFLLAAITAFTQTVIVFAGQNDAEGDRTRVLQSVAYCSLFSCIIGSGLGFAMYVFSDSLCLLYSNASEVNAIVRQLLLINAVPYGLCGIMEASAGAVRGCGKAISPTIQYLLGIGVFRIMWVKLYLPNHYSLMDLFLCYPLSWILTSIMEFTLLFITVAGKYNHHSKLNQK